MCSKWNVVAFGSPNEIKKNEFVYHGMNQVMVFIICYVNGLEHQWIRASMDIYSILNTSLGHDYFDS